MLHTQPAPAAAVGVRPAGRVSLTVTRLPVGPPPMFDTVSTYWAPTWPCKKLPVCTFRMVRSGTTMIVVGSLAELLLESTSPPPETMAVLVTDAGALGATFTVIVIGGYPAPGASGSLRVQGMLWPPTVHIQPVPVAPVNISPEVSASVTVMAPAVGESPVLLTVSV